MFRPGRIIFILLVVVSALLHSGCLNLTILDAAAVQGPCCEHMTDDCRVATVGCCSERAPAEGTATIVAMRAYDPPQPLSIPMDVQSPRTKDPLSGSFRSDTGYLAGNVPLRI
jgi:hypothetical protein